MILFFFYPARPFLTDHQQHHELLAPASVRQQLCGQLAQWLHDGLAEADRHQWVQQLHKLPSVPGHGEASAAPACSSGPMSASSACLHGHVPQLFLQRGEDGSARQLHAGQSCGSWGRQHRSSGQACSPQAQSAVSHWRCAHRLVRTCYIRVSIIIKMFWKMVPAHKDVQKDEDAPSFKHFFFLLIFS